MAELLPAVRTAALSPHWNAFYFSETLPQPWKGPDLEKQPTGLIQLTQCTHDKAGQESRGLIQSQTVVRERIRDCWSSAFWPQILSLVPLIFRDLVLSAE